MGQGYSLTTLPAGSAGIDTPEMSDLTYEKSLGKSRFMKCIRARSKEGLVITKVIMKPYSKLDLKPFIKIISHEREILYTIPNALPYHRIIETATNGYLIRQYINSSLYDRLSTRPFLESIEKKWLAFQLLCAVRDCHNREIYHGDIKTENCLLTSWNWLYLTDFSSSFKPTYLPEDNPADFTFFFDTSATDGRDRICYLAPERFLRSGEEPANQNITWAMDIFSVGCVIGELFTDRKFFTLAGILKYRLDKDAGPPIHLLNDILDPNVREMVAHMIQVNPGDRYSADDYLTFWKHKAFPEYFYSFLHQYMNLITDPSSGQAPLTTGPENFGEADDRIERVYNDFGKIALCLGYGDIKTLKDPRLAETDLFPLVIDLPDHRHYASSDLKRPPDDGSLIFLTIILSSVRHCARASSKVRACELLLAFAERIPDEAKLDRIIPHLMQFLNDESDMVKVAALRTVTQILDLVSVLRIENTFIFPEYLLRAFNQFTTSSEKRERPSPWVRATYAACLGYLATTASQFLDLGQKQPADDPVLSDASYQDIYDVARQDLIEQFEGHTKALLTDNDLSVRRALLPCVSTLCVFFGKAKASYVIIGFLNTYINDRDWRLKCAFFDAIVGVATYMGTAVIEEFILPLMVQALVDPEETVVQHIIVAFSSLAELGVFQSYTIWELVDIVGRFTMHPNIWIREAAIHFIAASAKFASMADKIGIIAPLIREYCKVQPGEFSVPYLIEVIKKPLPRVVLEMACSWATKTEKSQFWKKVEKTKRFTFSFGDNFVLPHNRAPEPKNLSKLSKSDEDEHWFERLRKSGMTPGDEFKLLVLQEYIWRTAQRRPATDDSRRDSISGLLSLNDLGIPLQTVIFDKEKPSDHGDFYSDTKELRTISDALQDATNTEAAPSRRDSSTPVTRPFHSSITKRSGPSDTLLSPARALSPASSDSRNSLRPIGSSLQKRGSAINLLGTKDSSTKSAANATTDTTNAVGQVELGHLPDEKPQPQTPNATTKRNRRFHDYDGNDPNILKLLEIHQLSNSPYHSLEFGQVVPVGRNEPLLRGGIVPRDGQWRPEGVLIAMLNEHTAGITRILPAPDHRFFITGSDDGTVKVWETARLERTVNHRARCTHNQGTKITSLAFVENTHCFVSSGLNGSIHIVKVDSLEKPSHGTTIANYSRGLQMIRDYHLPTGEFAVWMEHFSANSKSLLMVATNKSNIYAIDIRTMETAFELKNPPRHGTPTCFCVDRSGEWLLLGTTHGIINLFDLRFKLLTKTWGFQAGLPIHRIVPPLRRSSKKTRVSIAGGISATITALDLDKFIIREVYKAHVPTPPTTDSTSSSSATPKKPPQPLTLSSIVPKLVDITDSDSSFHSRFPASAAIEEPPARDTGIRALAIGGHIQEEGAEPRHPFYLAAGPDWKIRFWESSLGYTREKSGVICGADEGDERMIIQEGTVGEAKVAIEREMVSREKERENERDKERKSGSSAGKSIVSLQSRDLLKGHKDDISDVAVLEVPYGMVVSGDRAGMIYVWA